MVLQIAEELGRAGKRHHASDTAQVVLGVEREEPLEGLGVELVTGLTLQGVEEQSSAHSYPSVDPPHRKRHATLRKGFLPGGHVLVDGVHQCPVQIEQECRLRHVDVRSRIGGHKFSLRADPPDSMTPVGF